MGDIDIDELREAAKAASASNSDSGAWPQYSPQAMHYLVAAYPERILALCDEVERLEESNARLREALNRMSRRVREAEGGLAQP